MTHNKFMKTQSYERNTQTLGPRVNFNATSFVKVDFFVKSSFFILIFLFRIAKVVRDARWVNWASIVLPEFPCNGQIVESGAFISMNRPESQWSCTKRISVPNSPNQGKRRIESNVRLSLSTFHLLVLHTHSSVPFSSKNFANVCIYHMIYGIFISD